MTRMVRPGLRADVLSGKPLPAWLQAFEDFEQFCLFWRIT